MHVVRDCPLMFGSLRERTNNYYTRTTTTTTTTTTQGHRTEVKVNELNSRSPNSILKDNEQKSGRYEIDFVLSNVNLKTPTNYISELNSTSSHILQLRRTFK